MVADAFSEAEAALDLFKGRQGKKAPKCSAVSAGIESEKWVSLSPNQKYVYVM